VVFNPQAKVLEVEIVVEAKSVSTGSAAFDDVLRGPNLLAAIDHPQSVFRASQATWDGLRPKGVTGQLSLSGVTRPLTLTVTRWKCALNPLFRAEVCGGDLEATLPRGEFGLGFGAPWVSDEVKLRVQVEAVALPPAESKKSE
jgi:polyisoprenoid-binding protein YceI